MVLAEGVLRCRYRDGRDHEVPMVPGRPEELVVDLVATSNVFLAGQISDSTRSTLERQSADPQIVQIKSSATTQVNLGTITGLVLGAPEFQQR